MSCVLFWTAAAFAQPIPSAAESDRAPREIGRQQPFTIPDLGPPEVQGATAAAETKVPAGAEGYVFMLEKIEIEGAEAFGEKELAQLWKNDIGRKVSLAHVYDIVGRINEKYHDAGYVFSRAYIPAQQIEDGTVTIRIAEGSLKEIELQGPIAREGIVADILDAMLHENPLNIYKLEKRLLLLNDLPGAAFHIVLHRGADDAIGATITSEKKKSVTAGISADNAGSRYLGPWSAAASLDIAHGGPGFHSTRLTVSATPGPAELRSASVQHSIPLYQGLLNFVADASITRGRPGYTLAANDIENDSTKAGARMEWRAIRQRARNLTLSTGLDYKNSASTLLNQPFNKDRLRVLSVSSLYQWSDAAEGYNSIDASVSHGIPGWLGGSRNGDADLSRALGKADFLKAAVTAFRHQQLPGAFSVLAGVAGQASRDALLSSEEFGYGGQSFGRGYNPSEIVGDSGIEASLELRYDGWNIMAPALLQPFVFYDIGKIWNRDPGQAAEASAASAGLGIRLQEEGGFNASLALAKPLTRPADPMPALAVGRDMRTIISVSKTF